MLKTAWKHFNPLSKGSSCTLQNPFPKSRCRWWENGLLNSLLPVKLLHQAAGVHILRTKTMPFKLSMAVGNCTSFDNIKFYNFYHNKTIFILSLIFAASRTYLGFIAICCAHKHIIVSDGHSYVCNTHCLHRSLQCHAKLQIFQSYSKHGGGGEGGCLLVCIFKGTC